MRFSRPTGLILSLILLPLLMACSEEPNDGTASNGSGSRQAEELIVYQQATCGCCKKWMSHLEESGLNASTRHPEDLSAVKHRHDVAPRHQSCHTAVSSQGFVFEGHIPARYIEAFLADPPDGAIGLAVPGMPIGSPGMEAGDRFSPYQILLLMENGSSELFATVETAGQQYQP